MLHDIKVNEIIKSIFKEIRCKAALKMKRGRVQWLMLVIPALWEAEEGGSQDQEIETILVTIVKPRLY